jgi:hypothetical protein
MREGPVADVVQQRGGQRVSGSLGGEPLPERQLVVQRAEPADQARHDEGGADGMRETGVVGARVCKRGETELANPPQTLQLAGFEQRWHDGFFVGFERNQAMDWVSQDHQMVFRSAVKAAIVTEAGGGGDGELEMRAVANSLNRVLLEYPLPRRCRSEM